MYLRSGGVGEVRWWDATYITGFERITVLLCRMIVAEVIVARSALQACALFLPSDSVFVFVSTTPLALLLFRSCVREVIVRFPGIGAELQGPTGL